jgi:hypothetical protein
VNSETKEAVAVKILDKHKVVKNGMTEQIKKEVESGPTVLNSLDFHNEND